MKKTSINVCDLCNDRVSIHTCSICNKDVCRFCGYFPVTYTSSVDTPSVRITFEKMSDTTIEDRPVICRQCVIKLKTAYTKEAKEEIFDSYFKIMKKALTVQRLTEEEKKSDDKRRHMRTRPVRRVIGPSGEQL